MGQVIEYVRKQGPVIGFKVNVEEGCEDIELEVIRAKGEPYGCFYANKVVDKKNDMYVINVGWSLCNKKDEFSKREAIGVAKVRATSTNVGDTMFIPHSLEKKFVKFCERVKKYYRLNNFTHKYVVRKENMLDVQGG